MTKDHAILKLRIWFKDDNKRSFYFGDKRRQTEEKARARCNTLIAKYRKHIKWAQIYRVATDQLIDNINGTDL